MRELVKKHEFEVPQSLVQSQFEFLQRQYEQDSRGVPPSEEQKKQMQTLSVDQVRASLILQKIAQAQSIHVVPTDLEHEYAMVAQRINMPIEEVQKMYQGNEQALRNLKHRIKEERTVDYLLGQIQVSESK